MVQLEQYSPHKHENLSLFPAPQHRRGDWQDSSAEGGKHRRMAVPYWSVILAKLVSSRFGELTSNLDLWSFPCMNTYMHTDTDHLPMFYETVFSRLLWKEVQYSRKNHYLRTWKLPI